MSLLGTNEAKQVIENLQNKTHERKTFYNPYKKRFQPKQYKKRNIVPSKLLFPLVLVVNGLGIK